MKNFLKPTTLLEIIEHSVKEPVLVFKHSLTCPISAGAYIRMNHGIEKKLIKYPVYIVVVQEKRELSNEIEQILNITHESPQIILIKNKQAIYDASHSDIQVNNIPSK